MKPITRLALLLSIATASCSRDDTPSLQIATAVPRVRQAIRISGTDTTRYEFQYRLDNLVDTVRVYDNGAYNYTIFFTHGAEKSTAAEIDRYLRFDTTWHDAVGRLVRSTYAIEFTGAARKWFFYDSVGRLSLTTNKATRPWDSTQHIWKAHNRIAEIDYHGDTTRFTYDLSRPAMVGEPRHIASLLRRGRSFPEAANLQTATISRSGTSPIEYVFDSDGRIARTTVTHLGASVSIITIIDY